MTVGQQQVYIPLWRVIWMKMIGEWPKFIAYIAWVDAGSPCHVCDAVGDEPCDAGLHS